MPCPGEKSSTSLAAPPICTARTLCFAIAGKVSAPPPNTDLADMISLGSILCFATRMWNPIAVDNPGGFLHAVNC